MKKIAMNIVALVHSELQKGFYTLLMEEIDGRRQLPVILSPSEAQAISAILQQKSTQPIPAYDLINTIIQEFHGEVSEMLIEKVEEGVFQSYLLGYKPDGQSFKIQTRSADAIAVALKRGASIYINEKVLSEVGVFIEETGEVIALKDRSLKDHTITELEMILDDLVAEEKYKKACKIRDIIHEKKKLKRA